MNCEFEARVSLLMDGALPADEAAEVRRHVEACEVCQHLERDLVHLSRAIRSYPAPGTASSDEALAAILGNRPAGFWNRRVSVPVPAAVAASLAVALLGVWTAQWALSATGRGAPPVEPRVSGPASVETEGIDRFDRGRRALLYKEPRDDRLQ